VKKFLAILATVSLMATAATAAQFEELPNAIRMSGTIEVGDDIRFYNLLELRSRSNNETYFMILGDSDGGYLQPAAKIARMLRDRKIISVVDTQAECVSACALVWAGGLGRLYWRTSAVGVHSASENGEETPDSMITTTRLARELKAYGAPPAVIGKVVATEPGDLTWLTPADVKGWAHSADELLAEVGPGQPREFGYPTPQHPPVQPKLPEQPPVYKQYVMFCSASRTANGYLVSVKGDKLELEESITGRILARYSITEQHAGTKEYGSWVVTGKTKYGKYGAIFGGPNPRMAYANKKETVVHRCH